MKRINKSHTGIDYVTMSGDVGERLRPKLLDPWSGFAVGWWGAAGSDYSFALVPVGSLRRIGFIYVHRRNHFGHFHTLENGSLWLLWRWCVLLCAGVEMDGMAPGNA